MKTLRYLDGVAVLELDRKACVGCGLCTVVCPHRVFLLHNRRAKIVDRDGCMECGACELNCPVQAIRVNPEPGCGCAALIINSWLSRLLGKRVDICSC